MKRYVLKGVELSGTAVGALLLLAIGLYDGAQVTVIVVDLLVVGLRIAFVEAITSSLLFTGFMAASGLLLVQEVSRDRRADGCVTRGPPVVAIVPAYEDHEALETSVSSLLESTYEPLRIRIVTEPDDDRTTAEARRLTAHDRVECVRNGYPGSKAGAINYAVERADADVFAVFDADEAVDEGFVATAMHYLENEDCEVFQGRRVPRPNGPVEAFAYCERVIFHASYKLVEGLGFVNCRSSSTVFTRDAFDAVGGYDDAVTEDLVFAHACFREGVPVIQRREHTNLMEAPHSLRDFWGQRKRWRLGQIQALWRTLRGRYGPIRGRRDLASIGRMLSSLVGSLLLLVLVAKFIVLLVLDLETFYALPLAATAVTIGGVAWIDAREGSIDPFVPGLALAPLVYPVIGVLTIKALLEYGLSWNGTWYRVQKAGLGARGEADRSR